MTADVLLLAGVSGSGKTSYALRREDEGYVRLSVDEEMWARHGGEATFLLGGEEWKERAAPIERDLRERLAELVRDGQNVVVDGDFCTRTRRDDYGRLVSENGGRARIVFFDIPFEVAQERIAARDEQPPNPNAFPVDDELLAGYHTYFEAPAPDEDPIVVTPEEQTAPLPPRMTGL